MRTVFTTDGIPSMHRFDHWHAVACAQLLRHDSVTADPALFSANLSVATCGDLQLVLFENSPIRVNRTTNHASYSDPEEIFLVAQLSGEMLIESSDHQTNLVAGSMCLVDPCRAYASEFMAPSKTLVIKMPRRSAQSRLNSVTSAIMLSTERGGPNASLCFDFFGLLLKHSDSFHQLDCALLEEQTLDLVAASINEKITPEMLLSNSQSTLLLKLKKIIYASLCNPDLTSADVAQAAGISVRYANVVLRKSGMSVMRLVLERRLYRCGEALRNPKQMHRTVGEIAYSQGFKDLTHFGRVFRQKYGMAPTAFRKITHRPDGSW